VFHETWSFCRISLATIAGKQTGQVKRLKYYFDEAGDWEHPNAQHSIWPLMCGVLFTEKSYFNDIQRTFKVIRTERKILPSKFHAADASNSLKSSVFSVILDSLLSRKAKIIVRRVKPSLLRRTRLTPHDLYIEHASALIAKLAAGDAKPEIYSDMKFRGAYPMKIAEHRFRQYNAKLSDYPWRRG
jgi:hypothetical protein